MQINSLSELLYDYLSLTGEKLSRGEKRGIETYINWLAVYHPDILNVQFDNLLKTDEEGRLRESPTLQKLKSLPAPPSYLKK